MVCFYVAVADSVQRATYTADISGGGGTIFAAVIRHGNNGIRSTTILINKQKILCDWFRRIVVISQMGKRDRETFIYSFFYSLVCVGKFVFSKSRVTDSPQRKAVIE